MVVIVALGISSAGFAELFQWVAAKGWSHRGAFAPVELGFLRVSRRESKHSFSSLKLPNEQLEASNEFLLKTKTLSLDCYESFRLSASISRLVFEFCR